MLEFSRENFIIKSHFNHVVIDFANKPSLGARGIYTNINKQSILLGKKVRTLEETVGRFYMLQGNYSWNLENSACLRNELSWIILHFPLLHLSLKIFPTSLPSRSCCNHTLFSQLLIWFIHQFGSAFKPQMFAGSVKKQFYFLADIFWL